jgi:hypothetical protein
MNLYQVAFNSTGNSLINTSITHGHPAGGHHTTATLTGGVSRTPSSTTAPVSTSGGSGTTGNVIRSAAALSATGKGH